MSGDTAMEHRFRWDEMDSSNNKYEWAVAAPSDEILRRMWTGWSVVSLTCGFFALAVFTGMISKRQVRENSFNVYVMAVSFPDFMPGILCGVDCVLRVMEGDAYTRNQCKFQAFYTSFNVVCNSWMNALICWEIHRLLRCSMRRERYFPPTVCNVLRNSGIIPMELYHGKSSSLAVRLGVTRRRLCRSRGWMCKSRSTFFKMD